MNQMEHVASQNKSPGNTTQIKTQWFWFCSRDAAALSLRIEEPEQQIPRRNPAVTAVSKPKKRRGGGKGGFASVASSRLLSPLRAPESIRVI